MDDRLGTKLIQLITAEVGFYIRKQDEDTLWRKVKTRMKALHLSSAEEYYQLLSSGKLPESGGWRTAFSPLSQRYEAETSTEAAIARRTNEWKELVSLITTTESYFFRDQGQFSLLRDQILPELIERHQGDRTLRLWSAGCSTGEEVYSLAILVSELLPEWESWNLQILGTDINHQAIAKAREGTYDLWSFRMVDPAQQQKYFQSQRDTWTISDRIRRMVSFQLGNLVRDRFPNPLMGLYEVDLILCRNVFIYFDASAVALVLDKFGKTLSANGYLMTGHAELYGQTLTLFHPQICQGSVIYRRQAGSGELPGATVAASDRPQPLSHPDIPPQPFRPVSAVAPPSLRTTTPFAKAPAASLLSSASADPAPIVTNPVIKEAETSLKQGHYAKAIAQLQTYLAQSPHSDAYHLLAKAQANSGEYDQAKQSCQLALSKDQTAIAPHYLLAHLAEVQGDREEAKRLYKKIIYLNPAAIAAYLELSSLYEQEGDQPRANKMRSTALEWLKKLPPDQAIEGTDQLTAKDLLTSLQQP